MEIDETIHSVAETTPSPSPIGVPEPSASLASPEVSVADTASSSTSSAVSHVNDGNDSAVSAVPRANESSAAQAHEDARRRRQQRFMATPALASAVAAASSSPVPSVSPPDSASPPGAAKPSREPKLNLSKFKAQAPIAAPVVSSVEPSASASSQVPSSEGAVTSKRNLLLQRLAEAKAIADAKKNG